MSRFLIINADDFGLTDGVCRGIIDCADAGGITSTTAMICGEKYIANVEKHLPALNVPCGLHLQISTGRPVSPAMQRWCANNGGNFPNSPSDAARFPPDLVAGEWAAQVALFRKNFGEPSHIDTHHGLQNEEKYSEVFLQLARSEGLAARGISASFHGRAVAAGVPVSYAISGHNSEWTGTSGDLQSLLASLKKLKDLLPEGMFGELIVHPGYCDEELKALSKWCDCRALELEILSGNDFSSGLEQLGITRASFARLTSAMVTGDKRN